VAVNAGDQVAERAKLLVIEAETETKEAMKK
jgi:hypothetical protein